MSTLNKILKWFMFLFEGFLAIPILGGAVVIANGWAPLVIAFFLHALSIILLFLDKRLAITGNVVGVIGALFSWIPLVGWFFHTITAFLLFIEAIYLSFTSNSKTRYL
ncbi:hypothetical protein [Bacillus sp. AP8]|uniref:hypothetical protein n=1 Tax=Bacillus sp. AP8 TaxID=1513284 RepID=UPI0002FE3524|nr:hypothetical protein [Bacillus sp. AP8]